MTDEIFVQSLIDVDKWNLAEWYGTAFFHDPEGGNPPCLGIVFKNIEAGAEIFAEWVRRIGRSDAFEELRIAIIEGDIAGEIPGYSVHISSNPWHTEARARANGQEFTAHTAIVVSRVHRMSPSAGSPYLAQFKRDLSTAGRYLLLPVSVEREPQFDKAIEKREIHIRNAAEVKRGDRDSVVFPDRYFHDLDTSPEGPP